MEYRPSNNSTGVALQICSEYLHTYKVLISWNIVLAIIALVLHVALQICSEYLHT